VISERHFHQPFHYLLRQSIYLGFGIMVAFIVLRIDTRFWEKVSAPLILVSIVLLAAVLVPGIGRSVNGSMRWIGVGPMGMQISELVKLCVIIYIAGYLVRRGDELRQRASGFLKPMFVLAIIGALLLKEPDFGATVVILATAMAMMFLAGVRFWQFMLLLFVVAVIVALIAVASPYRVARLTTFLNPWAQQFDSGYQLTQSLIAFGRGGWLGVGLGESVQKLFYLPEAHTDFIFAVLVEELGLIGVSVVIGFYTLLVARILAIGRNAHHIGKLFSAYMAYGFAFWFGLQAMINMGVTSGALPTKGLTLPLISYGGSSMLVMCTVLALIMRIDHETRREILGHRLG